MNMNRKDQKIYEAEERNDYFANLTSEKQIESLDRRLGEGVGAVKQRAKIQRKIEQAAVTAEIDRKIVDQIKHPTIFGRILILN